MVSADPDEDFYQWTQDVAARLRARKFQGLDWDAIAEEMEDLGRSQKSALRSQLTRAMAHLLKLQYGTDLDINRAGPGWETSVRDARLAMDDLLEDNPSLKGAVGELLAKAYPKARNDAIRGLPSPRTVLPEHCPYSREQVLDEWWPR